MRKLFQVFILLLFSNLCYSQQNSAINFTNLPKDSILVNLLIEKSKEFLKVNTDSVIFYSQKALEVSEEINFESGMATSKYYLGLAYMNIASYQNAEKLLLEALELFEKEQKQNNIILASNKLSWLYILTSEYGLSITLARKALTYPNIKNKDKGSSFNNIAISYHYLGRYTEALEYYFKALAIFEADEYIYGISIAYNNIASVYTSQDRNDKALELYRNSLQLSTEINDTSQIAASFNNIGAVYMLMKNIDSAQYYFEISYELNNLIKNRSEIARVASNFAELYSTTKDYVEAQKYLDQAIEIYHEIQNNKDLSICYQIKGDILHNTGNITQAIIETEKALNYATISNSNEQKNNALKMLAELYAANNNFSEAYNKMVLYTELNDSLFNIEKTRVIESISVVYDLDKQEQRIILLENEQKITAIKNYFLIAVVIAILLLLIILSYFFVLRTKTHKQKVLLFLEEKKVSQLELEKKQLLLEKRHSENEKLLLDLEFKNKELAAKTMSSFQTNEFYQELENYLHKLRRSLKKDIKDESGKIINQIINQISVKQNDEMWKEFEVRFLQVHKNFYSKLSEQFPDLSPNEKKLCAFLKLNMNTKEISRITYQSPNSIRVARTRLRKKLQLSSDENLTNFIMNI